jgi:4-hydroxy-tetrahydrodipicolinate synthase
MFRGSIPALVTPFRDGKVDEKALAELVEWHVAEGSHGLVAVGTTGETPTLTHEEHRRCVEIVVGAAARRIPVIAGAGSNNTDESVSLMRHAKSVAPTRRWW